MATSSGPVLLAGATGYIGRAVAGELTARGIGVRALVRNANTRLPGCELRVAQATDSRSLAGAVEGEAFSSVVSCLASRSGVADDAWRVDCEANRNLLEVARRAGAARFLLLSAICVQRPKLEFQRAKLAFEADLVRSGMDYTIVRPTAFFKSLSGQVERVRRGKPFLVFGNGELTACKPISAADLARYIVDCLTDPAARNRVLPIGGPGPALSPREQGELLFELAGRVPRFRSVPVAMFRLAETLISPFAKISDAAAKKAELARIGRYYATESMLLFDECRGRYDADATPETGSDTLCEHYARVLEDGLAGHELGDHELF